MNRLHSWLSKPTLTPLSVQLTFGPGGNHQPEPHEDSAQVRESLAKLNDRELELTNLLGLALGCIEAKFSK